MLAEAPGGIFQQRKVHITAEGLEDRRAQRFYDNREECVFPVTKPYPLDTYAQLEDLPVPPAPTTFSQWMFIGEDNGFFPYSSHPITSWTDIETRQHRRLEYQEVGRQKAELHNIRRALGSPILTVFAIIAAIVTAMSMAVIGLVFFISLKDETTAGASLMVLLGAVAVAAPREAKRKRGRTKKVKPEPRWSVFVYDTLTLGKPYHYSLPYSEIAANIPEVAWRFPNLSQYRWFGLFILGGFITWIIFLASLIQSNPFLGIGLGIVLIPLFAGTGFLIGPGVAKRLFWYARPYVKLYQVVITTYDDDGDAIGSEITLRPMRHTGMTGVDPLIYQDLVRAHMEQMKDAAIEAGLEQMPQFDPVVNRADDAWEDIHGLLEREDTRIATTTMQKIQIGSFIVIAFSSVGIAFFILMATVG